MSTTSKLYFSFVHALWNEATWNVIIFIFWLKHNFCCTATFRQPFEWYCHRAGIKNEQPQKAEKSPWFTLNRKMYMKLKFIASDTFFFFFFASFGNSNSFTHDEIFSLCNFFSFADAKNCFFFSVSTKHILKSSTNLKSTSFSSHFPCIMRIIVALNVWGAVAWAEILFTVKAKLSFAIFNAKVFFSVLLCSRQKNIIKKLS